MEKPDNDDTQYEFVSGWDEIKKNHSGTLIIVAVVLAIVLYIGYGIYATDNNPQNDDCIYTDDGCQEDLQYQR